MKIKLYCIQEILNEPQPNDCVGELFIFIKEDEFNENLKKLSYLNNEYRTYEYFTKEIEINNG